MRPKTYWVSASTALGTGPTGTVRATSPREAAKKHANKVAKTATAPLLRVKVRASKNTLIADTFDAKPLIGD